MALRGSPVDSSVDLDPPASPNGSSSLHAAIAAAFPVNFVIYSTFALFYAFLFPGLQ